MSTLLSWLAPKALTFIGSFVASEAFEALVLSILETMVKHTKTKFDDEVLALDKEKIDE